MVNKKVCSLRGEVIHYLDRRVVLWGQEGVLECHDDFHLKIRGRNKAVHII
jgi:hypothetical protein